jgi:hypothetical protein
MDAVILSRSRKYGRNIIADSDFANLVNPNKPNEYIQADSPYFFFASELSLAGVPHPRNEENLAAYNELKKTQIRHCIPNRNNYVDYVAGKTYNTLEEWAVDNGKTLADVLYGINDIHFHSNRDAWDCSQVYFITLETLVGHIMPQKKVVNADPAIVRIDKNRMNRLIGMMEQVTSELKSFI